MSSTNSLSIRRSVLDDMIAQARAAAPIEACGMLAGTDGCATSLYRMTNADHSPDHFTMSPAEQFAVVRTMRAAGQKLLAIYHTHPASPARPSAEDLRLALTPDVTYVILSLENPANPVVKGFVIEGETVAEIPLQILNEDSPK